MVFFSSRGSGEFAVVCEISFLVFYFGEVRVLSLRMVFLGWGLRIGGRLGRGGCVSGKLSFVLVY